MRSSSSVGPPPRLALASSTGVPSAFSAQARVRTTAGSAPAAGSSTNARTDSPSTTMFW